MKKNYILSLMALSIFGLATSANSATFTVTSLADDGFANDSNPGDGICGDGFADCSLRAAIEETNALGGSHDIEFSVAGTITVDDSQGQMPVISSALNIDGRTAPGYAGGNTNLEDAPPAVFLDGVNVTGTAAGLNFNDGAANSAVLAIGIVNFSGSGITIAGGASGVRVDACYVGALADGTGAGNGNGLVISSANNTIGRFISIFDTAQGFGNVISGNDLFGIFLTSAGNTIAGNRIGTQVDGVGSLSNVTGIAVLSDNNQIGVFNDDENIDLGNLVGGNSGTGILISGGDDNLIMANRVGLSRVGNTTTPNGGIGIDINGNNNIIGFDSTAGQNELANNEDGIVIDGDNNTVTGNRIGFSTFNQGNTGDGIRINSGTGNSIDKNKINFNDNNGIQLVDTSSQTTISENIIGVDFTLSGGSGNGVHGVLINGNNNILIDNLIGNNNNDGISINVGSGNLIRNNSIGLDVDNLVPSVSGSIGNGTDGISIDGGNDNTIRGNDVSNSGQDGIQVSEFSDTAIRNSIYENRTSNNSGLGINLGLNGIDLNDAGDADTGPNNLQNYPIIQSTSYNDSVSPPEVTINWIMDSIPGESDYSIVADFYIADSETSGEGMVYIGARTVNAPSTLQISTFSLPNGPQTGYIVATGTDGNGFNNTSEFSPTFQFFVDLIFEDGFE